MASETAASCLARAFKRLYHKESIKPNKVQILLLSADSLFHRMGEGRGVDGELLHLFPAWYSGRVSTILEIEAALARLTDEELKRLGRSLNRIYRERHNESLYADSYGVYTEADLIASAEEAFLIYDREEERHGKGPAR